MRRRKRTAFAVVVILLVGGCAGYQEAPVIRFPGPSPPIVIQQEGTRVIMAPPEAATCTDPRWGRIKNDSLRLWFECWINPAFEGTHPKGPAPVTLRPFERREMLLPIGNHRVWCESTFQTASGNQPGPPPVDILVLVRYREHLLENCYGWGVNLSAHGGIDP